MADAKRSLSTLQGYFPDAGRGTPQNLRDFMITVVPEGDPTKLKTYVMTNAAFTVGAATRFMRITLPAANTGSFGARISGHVFAAEGSARGGMLYDVNVGAVQTYINPTITIGAVIDGKSSNPMATTAASISIAAIEPTVVVDNTNRYVDINLNVTKGIGTFTTVNVIGEVRLVYAGFASEPTIS